MHNLETRRAQPGVPLKLGHRASRIGILDRAVGLPHRPVSAPEKVSAADDLILISDPGLQVGRRQAKLVEGNPRDRLQNRLRPGVGKCDDPPGVLDARPAGARRYA